MDLGHLPTLQVIAISLKVYKASLHCKKAYDIVNNYDKKEDQAIRLNTSMNF